MKTKQIILINLFTLICQFTSAQIREGEYFAFEIKKGEKIPEVFTVTIINHDSFCKKFINNKTKSLLDGKYFISTNGFHIGNFSKGIPHGDWEYYYQDELYEKKAYVNGKIDGDFYEYNADGTPYSGKAYRDGFIRHSISRHANRQLREECFYDEKGQLHGHRVEYNDEGKLIRDETYEHGEKQGKFMEYDDFSGITRVNEYKNGKRIYNKSTFPDGSVESEGFYNDEGKQHGRFIYSRDGYIATESLYNNGIMLEEKNYFKDGSLKSIAINDENGKKKYSAYYMENPYYMREEHNYLDGEMHGLDKLFVRKDILSEETYYHKGDRIYKKYYDRDSGKINALYIVDETGHLVKVEEYNNDGRKIYKNKEYKKPSSIKLIEDASGIIDIEIK